MVLLRNINSLTNCDSNLRPRSDRSEIPSVHCNFPQAHEFFRIFLPTNQLLWVEQLLIL
ncbi:GSCOCG00013404001-RA-CDS [Cotesia congregata]|nr:GSCOCG00013404001-RA-CDS [Cotesia congregata]